MKPKYHSAFLDMAIRFGQTSEANRLKVGALLVRDGKILSQGVNGTPPKWESEVCEGEDGKTLPHVRHAEIACLEKLWNSTETAEGATMYISYSPCLPCAIKLLTAGVSSVYFKDEYRCDEGLKFLKRNGVEVKQLKGGNNEGNSKTNSHSCAGDSGCCAHSLSFKPQQERGAIATINRNWKSYYEDHTHKGTDRQGTTLSVRV